MDKGKSEGGMGEVGLEKVKVKEGRGGGGIRGRRRGSEGGIH